MCPGHRWPGQPPMGPVEAGVCTPALPLLGGPRGQAHTGSVRHGTGSLPRPPSPTLLAREHLPQGRRLGAPTLRHGLCQNSGTRHRPALNRREQRWAFLGVRDEEDPRR